MTGGDNKKPLDVQEIEGGGEKNGDSVEKDEDSAEKSGSAAALGICFGCAFGLLAQVITGDVIWLPVGVAVGCGLGFAVGDSGKKGE